ncbi:hypothetical protein AURDEDRAFT_161741 [Auricularia subglabra TFB-10046 SS5]|nr:hypothetical protein AURDEDRAFT_161741 [Auricularia subglabra TFB-10046 SS5]
MHAQRQAQSFCLPVLPTTQSQITSHAPAPRIELSPAKSVPANLLKFLISSPMVDDSERYPLFSEPPDSREKMQERRMEAISAVLEDIIAEDKPGHEERLSISSRWCAKTLFADDDPLPAVAEDTRTGRADQRARAQS